MSKPFCFGPSLSALALVSMLAGCAAPQGHAVSASSFGGKSGDVGLATRALAALNSNDVPTAIVFAERAVEKTPDDAGFRALLGNVYFAAGRFASAEAAYKDALSIFSNQPQVILKLALTEIAEGKSAEAVAFLNAGKDVLDASDYGLALALAGQPADAISVLEPVARSKDADAQVRQNLALAYALSGDWTSARTIAAQDVPGDQLDSRIQQWMKLAKPMRPAEQVAALVGVTPAASDPGEPVRLALRKTDTQLAVTAPAPQPQVAQAAPALARAPVYAPVASSVSVAQTEVPVPAVAPAPESKPSVAAEMAAAAAAAPEAPSAFAAMMAFAPHKAAPKPVKVAAPRSPVRRASLLRLTGNSNTVLQLGAYGSPQRVAMAWSAVARRFASLRGYSPMSARFDSPRGTVYRLSLRGFSSDHGARLVCESLRRVGGSCFVRSVAGDAPVQFASR